MENTARKDVQFYNTTCTRIKTDANPRYFNGKPFNVVDFNIEEAAALPEKRENDELERNAFFNFGKFDAKECLQRILTGNAEFKPPAEAGQALKGFNNSVKRRKKRNEFDGEPSIDAYLSGSMQPYIKKHRQTSNEAVNVDIYINIGLSWKIDAEEVKRYYNTAINEAFKMVLAGKMVNIYAFSLQRKLYKNGNHGIFRTQLKEAGQPIDFKRIGAAIYPAFFRHIFFKAFHICKFQTVKTYGGSIQSEEVSREIIKIAYPETVNKDLKIFDFRSWKQGKI